MTITFNPDPKLQAEAMWKQFYNLHNGLEVGAASEQIRCDKAKESALLTAEMCRANSTYFGSDFDREPGQRFSISDRIHAYWSAVIEHLEKS